MIGLLPPIADGLLDHRALKRAGGLKALKAAKGAVHRARSLAALELSVRDDRP